MVEVIQRTLVGGLGPAVCSNIELGLGRQLAPLVPETGTNLRLFSESFRNSGKRRQYGSKLNNGMDYYFTKLQVIIPDFVKMK